MRCRNISGSRCCATRGRYERVVARSRLFAPCALDAIERIGEYTADLDGAGFLQNRLVQDAVIRNIEIIGEACSNICKREPEFAREHAEVPWGFAIGMRNVLAHGYFKVDLEAVWQTVERDLPVLAGQIRALLDSAGNR